MSTIDVTAPSAPGTPRSRLAVWFIASRPKTLAAGVVPVLAGAALAFGEGVGKVWPALAALIGAILIQIGTNFVNDHYDFKKGADTEERLGPLRVTQAGLLAPRTVLNGAFVTFGLALAVGVYLVVVGGWPILVIGLLSLVSGYAYTGGPYPLGYNGLGDLFVFVFFGLIAAAGTYYVQADTVTLTSVAAGVPLGALATCLLAVNNLRDVETDSKVGKRTLVVRLGVTAGRAEYVLMVLLAYATPVALFALGLQNAWVLLPFVTVPFAIAPVKTVLTESGRPLNVALGGTARLLMLFGLTFSVGLYLGAR